MIPVNLGLGEGAPVIGSPFPWPHAKMPNELFPSMAGMVFLKSNGASFSDTLYPKLALTYPGLKLADLRGEFIRGWDDARGVDTGRAILSAQGDAIRNITGQVMGSNYYAYRGSSSGVFFDVALAAGTVLTPQSGSQNGMTSAMDVSRQVPTAAENRPRNVAFNYIVRAA